MVGRVAALPCLGRCFSDAGSFSSDASSGLAFSLHLQPPQTTTRILIEDPRLSNQHNMGRFVNQYDRSQGWRVQKQRHEKARDKLPAWYRRVSILDITENRNIHPSDYDQDLSELDEANDSSIEDEEPECTCDSDADCDCGFEDEDMDSEKSVEGSEAELYYELKEDREKRKRHVLKSRLAEEKGKKEKLDFVTAKEDEVNASYAAFKKARRQVKKRGETIPIDFTIPSGGTRQYQLYSSDHVRWLYDHSMYSRQRADFHYVDNPDSTPLAEVEQKPLFANIFTDPETNCHISPMPIPTSAKDTDIKVESCEEKYDVRIKFFDDKYLKLSVPREMIFQRRESISSGAPTRFEFVGILRDIEKEKGERRKRAEEKKKNHPASRKEAEEKKTNRSASPRESYFEMNHPMGSWAQSRW